MAEPTRRGRRVAETKTTTETNEKSNIPDEQPTPAELEEGKGENAQADAETSDEVPKKSSPEPEKKEEKGTKNSSNKGVRVEVVARGTEILGKGRAVGERFILTPQQVERTKDRKGNTWTDIIDDEEAQKKRYGKRLFKSF